MKSKLFITVLISAFCMCLFQSCVEEKEEFTTTVSGTATISKNPVKNGDEVCLSIGGVTIDINGNISTTITIDGSVTINGKEVGVPNVHYYIDDKLVGTSNDKAKGYAFKYKVTGLQPGEHVLRAEAVPQEKGTTFRGGYTSTNFVVEASK